MFCPNCGRELEGSPRFCRYCGSAMPQYSNTGTEGGGDQGPVVDLGLFDQNSSGGYDGGSSGYNGGTGGYNGGNSGKKHIPVAGIAIIVVICLVIVIAGVVVYGAIGGGSSSSKSGDSILPESVNNTLEAVFLRDDALAFLQTYQETDTVGVTVTADNLVDLLVEAGLDTATANEIGLSISAEAAYAKEDQEMSLNLVLNMLDETYDGDLYVSLEELILSIPVLFEETYMVDLTSAAEDLEASVFNPDNDGDYAMYSSDYEMIMEILESYAETISENEVITYDELISLYFDELEEEELMPEFEETKTTVTVGGEDVSCKAHTAEITAEELADIVSYTADFLEEHVDETTLEVLEDEGYYLDDLDDLADELEDDDVTYVVEYDVKGDYMIRLYLEVTYGEDGPSEAFVFDFGEDPASTEEVTIEYIFTYSDGDEDIDTYTLELETDDDEVGIALTYYSDYLEMDVTVFEFERDQESGEFEFGYNGYVLEGTAVVSDETMTLSDLLLTWTYSGTTYTEADLTYLTIVLNQDAEVSELSDKAVNFLTLSEDALDELVEEVYLNASAISSALYYALYY